MRDLAALPKGHLHLHLEAAIRPATLAEMAAGLGVDIPPVAGFEGFAAFSGMYRGLLQVLSVPANYERLVDEAVEDAAADGVVYAEFGVSPQFYVQSYGSLEGALEATAAAARAAGERHGVEIGLMVTVDRSEPLDEALELARAAAAFAGRGVVSLGLANEERGYPPEHFAEPFAIAREAGLLSTPHAGELVGPESVRGALDALHADRLLHGVRALEDPALVERIVAEGVCLDVCPTSNVILGVVPSLAEHPLPALLAAGVRASINADDPILFGPGILEEYENARVGIGLSDEQLAACALSSVECSGASEATKASARSGISAWLAS